MDKPTKYILYFCGYIIIIMCLKSCLGSSNSTTSDTKPTAAVTDGFEAKVARERAKWKYDCDVMDSLKGPDVRRVFYNADQILSQIKAAGIPMLPPEPIYSRASNETKDHVKDLHKFRIVSDRSFKYVQVELEYDAETHDMLEGVFTYTYNPYSEDDEYDQMLDFICAIGNIFDHRIADYYDKKLDKSYFNKPDSECSFDGDFDLPDKNIAFTITKDIQNETHPKTVTMIAGWIIHHPNHYYDIL